MKALALLPAVVSAALASGRPHDYLAVENSAKLDDRATDLADLAVFKSPSPAQSRRLFSTERRLRSLVRLSDDEMSDNHPDCETSFQKCDNTEHCVDCLSQTQEARSWDWTVVTRDMPCEDLVAFLKDHDICLPLKISLSVIQFCETFRACVIWDDEGHYVDPYVNRPQRVRFDCDSLTECYWEGMNPKHLNDGICNESRLQGCYNSKVCGWDGGDCCMDTCKKNKHLNCGDGDFLCRDPSSKKCESRVSKDCNPDIVVDDWNFDDDDDVESSENQPSVHTPASEQIHAPATLPSFDRPVIKSTDATASSTIHSFRWLLILMACASLAYGVSYLSKRRAGGSYMVQYGRLNPTSTNEYEQDVGLALTHSSTVKHANPSQIVLS